jgi:hypothetical protein
MFLYNAISINELEGAISADRMATYVAAANNNDKAAALKLYLWNSEISSAFYVPLQGLEITLRNSLHVAMSARFQTDRWYDAPAMPLDTRGKELVQNAKEAVRRGHPAVNPPHVIAELSFGFWVSLLNKKYHQSLWIPALGKAFPHAHAQRSSIHQSLDYIRILRNRIAHHEPIFGRHLAQDYQSIIQFIGWMNQTKAAWIDQHNSCMQVLGHRP